MKFIKPLSLEKIAKTIDATLVASNKEQIITAIGNIEGGNADEIAFLGNPKYGKYLSTTNCSAVIIEPNYESRCQPETAKLITKNPRLALSKLVKLCIAEKQHNVGVHISACVESSANIDPSAVIKSNVYIGKNSSVGKNTIIYPGCYIGDNVTIGDDTVLYSNVNIYDGVSIGSDSIIHSGVVIGSDGFGFANDSDGSWVKMPHLGNVVVGNKVEIGSNTTIDRGFMENTVIGNGVIIDNLVQVGHNVQIGDHTAIAGCVAIAGSVAIGKNCMIGGKTAIAGHISLCDRVIVTGGSGLNRSITKPGIYSSGMPAKENAKWRKNISRFYQLDDMARKIKELEKELEKVSTSSN